jgi:hypothetical protein
MCWPSVGQGAVAGLVGDGPAGAAEVAVGDEPDAEAVGPRRPEASIRTAEGTDVRGRRDQEGDASVGSEASGRIGTIGRRHG